MELTIQDLSAQLTQRLATISDSAHLDAQVLLAHHLQKSHTWILAHPEAPVIPGQQERLLQSILRLEAGEPLPYVLGHWEFYRLDFVVNPSVLIPRPETELLVERAIQWLQLHPHRRRVVDVGTGSGCIAISVARHVPDALVIMADISQDALEVARFNATKHAVLDQTELIQSDLLSTIAGPIDLICANLPYIPSPELRQLDVFKREPQLALDGGKSGIELISRLLVEAREQLVAGGLLLLEIEAYQGAELQALARQVYPQSCVQLLKDLSAHDRCLEIERPYQLEHICTPQEWQESQQLGEFRDLSLLQAGFIHFCQPEQLIEVANRYYHGSSELVVLRIDPRKLTTEVRWEKAGSTYYPHVYGPVNLDAIESATSLQPEGDGLFR